ncbi:methionyl-tRNA formyltransferase [Crocinitomicaceae bacterium]|nr:methionyl-tRNA formyltransferase [Crocinitomicaceae bacterium]MDC1203672.1 methionyl-tRNA formyltransferase [Crocinitomicaceae bacterium]
MTKKLRIVFMGTPTFAVTVLDRIVKSGHQIVGVVTAPDRPSGRGQQIRKSDVKIYAEEKELSIFQPLNLKDDSFITQMKDLNADVFIVVAFRMLPAVVWKIPPMGTINLHASLLPDYRGAAPINWAIMNGEKTTGVTTFFINEVIDTGDIIKRKSTEIHSEMTAGDLHDQLMSIGGDLISETLKELVDGKTNRENQILDESSTLNAAPKIFKNDCKIDWANSLDEVYNKIRGLSPYPGAWCILKNRAKNKDISFKLYHTRKTDIIVKEGEKNRLTATEDGILFPCSDYHLRVIDFQMEGKRRMNFKDFLAGNSIEDFVIIQ